MMTGRQAGVCAGYDEPGRVDGATRGGGGRGGRGFGGGGGRRRFGWGGGGRRFGWGGGGPGGGRGRRMGQGSGDPRQEVGAIQNAVRHLAAVLENITRRLDALDTVEPKEESETPQE